MVRVSTIIPVYNNASTVSAAIDSALAQNFEGQEIIVVDDGSTDATPHVLEGYGRKIKVVTQPNRGRSAARNTALASAQGAYVAFLDADDEWLSGKLAKTVPVLDADPGCVLVYSDALVIDGEGRIVQDSIVSREYTHPPTLDELLEVGRPPLTSAVVMRRAVVETCGGFDESFGRHWGWEDTALFLRARELGRFHYIAESLVRYRASTVIENLRKRRCGALTNGYSMSAADRFRGCFGQDRFIELIVKRYGERAHPLVRRMNVDKEWSVLPMAMLAMHDGDRQLARHAYLSLLRRDPLHPQTYVRLLWTFLPLRLSRSLSRLLPEKYQRALMGPPEDKLLF